MPRTITASTAVRLVPVLEVSPYSFSTRPHPPGPARDHAAAWDAYFRDGLADAGFTDVTPIAPGTQFVPARSLISHPLLDHLLREALTGTGLPGFPLATDTAYPELTPVDRISMLEGGYALLIDGHVCFPPSCCGDLGSITDWEATIVDRPAHGEIWIGHPALAVAWHDDLVTLTEQSEYPSPDDDLLEATIPAASLVAAVATARTDMTAFHADLIPPSPASWAPPHKPRSQPRVCSPWGQDPRSQPLGLPPKSSCRCEARFNSETTHR